MTPTCDEGRRTASKVWGNQISILVGDYLYSRAICQIVDFRNQGINEALSEACRKDGRRRGLAVVL
jgi:octaprenyl-diphosphate synthase